MIRQIGFVLLFCGAVAWGAVSGTIRNGTTGQPQPGAEVTLYKFGQGGMEPVDHVKTDAQGSFVFNQDAGGQGPSIVRVERDGVTYNHLMPPGTPTTGFTVTVYDASKQPGEAKVSKHMLLFQPGPGQMVVNETFIVENKGKTTWFNPGSGTVEFFLPKGAGGNVDVKGTSPDGGGMAVPVPTDKAGRPDVYSTKFEVKPGETRFDLSYSVPYTEGQPYAGRIPSKDDNTYLIAPNGVTLTGRPSDGPGHRAAHPGSHLRPAGRQLQDPAHRHGSSSAGGRYERPGGEQRPGHRADHAPHLRQGQGDSGAGPGNPGTGIRPAIPREPRRGSPEGVE